MGAVVCNLLDAIPEHLDHEVLDILARGTTTRIERIVSRAQCSPVGFWYDQEDHEWVIVLRGRARLALAQPNEEVELGPGDYITIQAHRRHRVEWTAADEATVWLAVHYR